MILGYCNPTGIGSLPLVNLADSHQLIKATFPLIPHWPQLPKLGESEGFINQYLTPLLEIGLVKLSSGKTPYFDTQRDDFTTLLTEFYELFLQASEGDQQALAKFGFARDSARGFFSFLEQAKKGYYPEAQLLKGQVSGPVTLGLQVTDFNKKASYYDDQLRDVLVKALAMHGKWQANKLLELGLPVIIFIDDPGLYSFGLSTHITLTKEGITADLTQVVEAISSTGSLVGSHTCASTDWSLLLDLNLHVVNFDSYQYFSSISVFPAEIDRFLAQGGVLAFGIIPTSKQIQEESVRSLVDLFSEQVDILATKGIQKEKLLQQAIITPSCGTGSLPRDVATTVYNFTKEVSKAVKIKYSLN